LIGSPVTHGGAGLKVQPRSRIRQWTTESGTACSSSPLKNLKIEALLSLESPRSADVFPHSRCFWGRERPFA
jgi:hypothetical protein